MTRILVRARGPLRGSTGVPSDKSIGHRALLFGALSRGTCRVAGFSSGEDNLATMEAFRSMGVSIEEDRAAQKVVVHGRGLLGLSAPKGDLDCGNSGTTMRLLCGVLAAQPFESRLIGDASLSRRPMGRVAVPLRARGGRVDGTPHPSKKDDITAPLLVGPAPAGKLKELEYRLPVSSAQLKSALLLSGLYASGPTTVYEPLLSRDHTERMLSALGVPIRAAGTVVHLSPLPDPLGIPEFDVDLPGDLSAAAFVLCAAQIVPGSQVGTVRTGLNPSRAGILDVIRAFRGAAQARTHGDVLGEPFGEVVSVASELRATHVGGEIATRSIDEIPIASVLAARARGTSEFSDVGELRVKESDRIARVVELLRAFGVGAEEREHGFVVEGKPDGALTAARLTSHGDHRIAMTGVVLGLVADGETVVEDADCIATSFPGFVPTLRALGADVEVA